VGLGLVASLAKRGGNCDRRELFRQSGNPASANLESLARPTAPLAKLLKKADTTWVDRMPRFVFHVRNGSTFKDGARESQL
jgi:hypothetical protein